MDSAENAALSSGGSDGAPGSYYDARWLNVHADDGSLAARARRLALTPMRHFDHIAVNTSYSAVLMPPYINVEGMTLAGCGSLAAKARRLALTPMRHFDHIAVNTSYSAVLMPPYINVEGWSSIIANRIYDSCWLWVFSSQSKEVGANSHATLRPYSCEHQLQCRADASVHQC
ncbi:hypothetical protein O0L34_g9926 [Tuta absoluta]|nr:hypothetical protein O0L34_g9926 [Tuta absoluta]